MLEVVVISQEVYGGELVFLALLAFTNSAVMFANRYTSTFTHFSFHLLSLLLTYSWVTVTYYKNIRIRSTADNLLLLSFEDFPSEVYYSSPWIDMRSS